MEERVNYVLRVAVEYSAPDSHACQFNRGIIIAATTVFVIYIYCRFTIKCYSNDIYFIQSCTQKCTIRISLISCNYLLRYLYQSIRHQFGNGSYDAPNNALPVSSHFSLKL